MFCKRINCTVFFLLLTGLAVIIQAEISVNLMLKQPGSSHVFEGDQIKLTCESNHDEGEKVDLTWHYEEYDARPAISNSSNGTSIVTRHEGNKTTSVLTVDIGKRDGKSFYIYCTARTAISNELRYKVQPFKFVSASELPRISVRVPRNETVKAGTRRHTLQCEVFSNVEMPELYITWLFGNQTIAEKLVRTAHKGKHSYLLQCLTPNDLGNYTCIANTTLYEKVWHASGTTFLAGNLPENNGMRSRPSLILHFVIFLLIIWKTT